MPNRLTLADARRIADEPCDLHTEALHAALDALRCRGNHDDDVTRRAALQCEIRQRAAREIA